MATLTTVHTFQLTTEELSILSEAMRQFNAPNAFDTDPETGLCLWEPTETAVALEKLLLNISNSN